MKSLLLSVLFFLPFCVWAQNETEPNNSLQTSTSLTLQNNTVTINGTINPVGDLDFYKFTVPRAGIISYKISSVATDISMLMELYNEDQVLIPKSTAYGGKGQNYTKEIKVCKGGVYYIRLKDDNDFEYSPQLYNLTVSFDASDVYECNDDYFSAQPIQLCQGITPMIRTTGDLDFFKFNVSSAGDIKVRLLEVPLNINMEMKIFNSGKTQVGKTITANVGQTISGDITLPSSGDYFIQLNDRSNDASNDKPYKFSIEKGCVTSLQEQSNIVFNIFPNPANERLVVTYSDDLKHLYVMNLAGQLLLQKGVEGNQTDLNVGHLPNGLYFLQIEAKDGRKAVQKFVKN